MTNAQFRFLCHVRDWHDGQLDGRAEAELQTGLYAAAFDKVSGAVVRRGWMLRDGTLTGLGREAIGMIESKRAA